ncbi:peptidoglycan DD-metalloendopeptidase family protein [Pedobacter sp. HMF7647]|uniref:Peptidoglycan DD-metalloendopeptidase family protein n=1 Tax=Hufsiella arboris TaxID=2695275 RepID=A0A7K1Y9S2_9SPHI|nr:M23 family metallopeptidase [Hufsiella arboris]MXV51091.1 peptidoglycan DD-metalloendopeptidase family protein [Hufsiella arboris]
MGKIKNDVSTVIIVNKNQQQTQSLRIKTKHIYRLKHYAVFAVLVVLSLVVSVIYLKKENKRNAEERQKLIAEVYRLQGQIPKADTVKETQSRAQQYIEGIESKLKNINSYLAKRGLKGFSHKSIGGPKIDTALSEEQSFAMYDDYLSRILKDVASTPMGYPKVSDLTSFFGYRSDPFNGGHAEFHPGIDFRGNKGDKVTCTANGTVVSAGWSNGYGNCVRIRHANNYETLYGHLSKINVSEGEKVKVGDNIGLVGSTGRSTGNHLHYEVRKNGKLVNPVNYLRLN